MFLIMENIFTEKTLWLHISGNATNAMFPSSCAVNVNILNKTIFASYSEHVKKTNTQRYGWWGRETANKNRQIDKGVPRGFRRKKPLNDAAILSTKPNQFSRDTPYMSAWKSKMVCKWKSRGLVFLFADLASKKFAMGARLANLEANFWSLFYFSNVSKECQTLISRKLSLLWLLLNFHHLMH